jgi:hypothetical protein
MDTAVLSVIGKEDVLIAFAEFLPRFDLTRAIARAYVITFDSPEHKDANAFDEKEWVITSEKIGHVLELTDFTNLLNKGEFDHTIMGARIYFSDRNV